MADRAARHGGSAPIAALTIGLVLALMLTAAACGPGGGLDDDDDAAPPATGSAAPAVTEVAEPDEPGSEGRDGATSTSTSTARTGDDGADGTTGDRDPTGEPVPPEQRAMVVTTGACGSADPMNGSGIAIDDRLVLTAAHVVAGADTVAVAGRPTTGVDLDPDDPDARTGPLLDAVVVGYDPLRDLALLATDPDPGRDGLDQPATGELDERDRATIVGGLTSGTVDATVERVVRIEMDEVAGTGRSTRDGYELRATTDPGDSGAGLFDRDGMLVGLVFGESTDEPGRTWATAASEIVDFLDGLPDGPGYACDPDTSELAPLEP